MSNKYECPIKITKEVLDSIKVGDLVKINDWKKPMRVIGASANFFVMIQKNFGQTYYSVCEKKPATHTHNGYTKGMFNVGPDHWLFPSEYHWDDPNWVAEYLATFERGEALLSERRALSINLLRVKRAA